MNLSRQDDANGSEPEFKPEKPSKELTPAQKTLAEHGKCGRALAALLQQLLKCQVQMVKSADSRNLATTVKALQKEGNVLKTSFAKEVVVAKT